MGRADTRNKNRETGKGGAVRGRGSHRGPGG